MSTVKLFSTTEKIKTMNHTPVAAVEVDTVTVVNGRVTFAYAAVAAGAIGAFVYAAEEVEAPKAAVAITEGDIAYYDATADNFTNVDTGNTKCGMFLEAALSGDATVDMELDNSVNL